MASCTKPSDMSCFALTTFYTLSNSHKSGYFISKHNYLLKTKNLCQRWILICKRHGRTGCPSRGPAPPVDSPLRHACVALSPTHVWLPYAHHVCVLPFPLQVYALPYSHYVCVLPFILACRFFPVFSSPTLRNREFVSFLFSNPPQLLNTCLKWVQFNVAIS